MKKIEVYTKSWCGFCVRAKALLASKELVFEEVDVTSDLALLQEMIQRANSRTVPQIFIEGEPIGGFTELAALSATGELDRLLAES